MDLRVIMLCLKLNALDIRILSRMGLLELGEPKYSMGLSQSNMYVLMAAGDVEVCAMGIFSTLKKAQEYSEMLGEIRRRMWIEKFCVDDPTFYEDESEYIVWKS